jgi:hypothetical protein
MKIETSSQNINLSNDICNHFSKSFIFYSKPKNSFLMTYWILDFQNKILKKISTDLNENMDEIKGIDQNILNIQTHAACSINPNGFYCLPLIGKYCHYFYYVNLKNDTLKLLSAKDLKHDDSKYWGNISSTFSMKENSKSFLLGCKRTDIEDVVDIIEVDENLNCNKIFSISNQTNAPHELVEYKDYIIVTHFNNFKGVNLNTSKKYNSFQDVLDDNIDLSNGFPSFIKIASGEIHFFNRKTKELQKEFTDAPPTAHISIADDKIFLSQHNLLAAYNFYEYTGPAKISKWELKDDKWIETNSFQHDEIFRCSSHVAFKFNDELYIMTMGYPNRLVFIDERNMKIYHKYDFKENILSCEDPKRFVNTLHTNPQLDYYHSNDANISQDGKMVIYIENHKVRFYDFENQKSLSDYILFENENVTGKNPIMHTKFI